MKRLLLAGAVLALPLMMAPKPAHAVFCENCSEEVTQLASWAKQAADMASELGQLMNLYHMAESTYNAISHATNVQGVASALGGVTATFMPEAAPVVNFVAGSGSVYGIANGLQGLSRLADVGNDSAWAKEMKRRELATANCQAIAHAGMTSAQDSLHHLGVFLGILSDAKDGTAVSAVGHGIAVEQQNLQNHQTQITNLQISCQQQAIVTEQRAEQGVWLSAHEMKVNSGNLGE